MKRKAELASLAFFLVLSIFIFFPANVQALELEETKIFLGANYNTYNLETFEKWVADDYGVEETFSGGFGFFLGARQWISGPGFGKVGIGAEIERMSVSYSELDISLSNTGFLFSVAYPLSGFDEALPEFIALTGAGGVYLAIIQDREVDVGEINYRYVGPGFKVGFEGAYPVDENISLGGRLNYRYSQPHSEGDVSFNGLELGAQVDISF